MIRKIVPLAKQTRQFRILSAKEFPPIFMTNTKENYSRIAIWFLFWDTWECIKSLNCTISRTPQIKSHKSLTDSSLTKLSFMPLHNLINWQPRCLFHPIPSSTNNVLREIHWGDVDSTCPNHSSQCFKTVTPMNHCHCVRIYILESLNY